MPCPKCGSVCVTRHGYYLRRRRKRQRFNCKKCGYNFSLRDVNYRKKITKKQRTLIKKIAKIRKTPNRFDSTKKRTYSTREISRFTGFSKSSIAKILKERD